MDSFQFSGVGGQAVRCRESCGLPPKVEASIVSPKRDKAHLSISKNRAVAPLTLLTFAHGAKLALQNDTIYLGGSLRFLAVAGGLGRGGGRGGVAGVEDGAAGLSLDLDASLDSAGFDSLEDSDEESELLGA